MRQNPVYWQYLDGFFQSPETVGHIFTSLMLVVLVILMRKLTVRGIKSLNVPDGEQKRRWIIHARNAWVLVLILGLVVIWAAELKTFAISLVAIAAALVLATKELILCVMGGMLRTTARLFAVGDRIEIGHNRGDVVDHTLLTTTLYEIGPGRDIHQYTGRSIVVPNSLFLTHSVVNETATHKYVLHVFNLPFKRTEDWRRYEDEILEAARLECHDYYDEAKRYFVDANRSKGLDSPSIEPRIFLSFPDPDKIMFHVRIPAPSKRRGRVEQAIIRRFLHNVQVAHPVPVASHDPR